jgi:hypothetical protein
MKANYQIMWLAFFAFGCDKVDVSLPENFKPDVGLSPTYMQFFYLLKHKDTDLTYSNSASTSEQVEAESEK